MSAITYIDPMVRNNRRIAADIFQHIAGIFRHQHSADRASHAADTDDRSDRATRHHVRRQGEQVGGPALMCGGGEADNRDRDKKVFGIDGETDR